MNGLSSAPAPEPPPPEEPPVVEGAPAPPEGPPAAPQGVSPEDKAKSDADDAASEAEAQAALAELHEESMTVVTGLKAGDKPKIPTDIVFTDADIEALLKDENIDDAEALKDFFKDMPTVEDVKKVKADLETKDMKLKDWVKLLKELKKPETSGGGTENSDESGFMGGIAGMFGKMGEWIKDIFVKLKLMFAKWFGGEAEDPAKEAEAAQEAQTLQGSMQPIIKKLIDEGKLTESMTLTPMGVRNLNKLGIDSPEELYSFLKDKKTVEQIKTDFPEYKGRLENITLDSYVGLLNRLPEADVTDDTAPPEDTGDTGGDTAPAPPEDTGDTGGDTAPAPPEPKQAEAPTGSTLDNYFWDYPRGNNELTRKDALPFETKDGGPAVLISKNKIAVGPNEFNMSLRLKADVPATPVSILKINQTNAGFTFTIKAIGLGTHDVPLTIDETKALIKGLQSNQSKDEWEHPVKPKAGSKAAGISDMLYFRFKQ